MKRIVAPLATLLAAVASAACGGGSSTPAIDADPGTVPDAEPGPDAPPPVCPGGMPPMQLTRIADGLDQPVYVTSPPGDAGTLFVVEKEGTIRIVRGGAVLPTPFLDIRSRVHVPGSGAEGGLLGLAFAPDYGASGRFFVHFSTDTGGNDRVAITEFVRSAGDPDVADPDPVREVISADHSGWNHVGGMIAFGGDGYLYVGIGDAATGAPSPARDLDSRLGKILRVDVDDPAVPPPGNLAGGDPFVWDYGLRNPWRFSFDRVTHALFIGDVGEGQWEEIDVEPAGQGNRDYGWDVMEGTHCFGGSGCPAGEPPVVEHPHSEASSIIGGYVYRGTQVPCLYGRYVYSDYGTGRFFSFVWDGDNATQELELTGDLNPGGGISSIVSFGEDANGELHVVTLNGRVYRIELE